MSSRQAGQVARQMVLGGLLGGLWLLAPAWAQAPAARNAPISLLAVVNDQVITSFDVLAYTAVRDQRTMARYQAQDLNNPAVREQLEKEIGDERRRVANRLIDQELLFTEFQSQGHAVPNDMVLRELDAIVARQTNGDYEKFYAALAEQKISPEEFREQIRKGAAVRLLLHQEVDRKIIVSPTQIRDYYEAHRTEFGQPGQVRVQMLMLKQGPQQADKLATVTAGLKAGEDFAALASKHTDGPLKEQGGDLGWMDSAKIRPEFQQALSALAVGAVSAPITLSDATVFLRKVEEKPMQVPSYEESGEKVRSLLAQQERDRRYEAYLARLRSKAFIRKFFKD